VAEPRRLGLRALACGVSVILALGAAAFLVESLRERDDARTELARARVELRTARATSSSDAADLADAQETVQALHGQLTAVADGATAIGALDDQDLAAVGAAVQAGLAGDLAAYNSAVDQRSALDPEHDAALEQLRQQVNTVITALDALRD
jgi:hypothetical protein